MLPTRPPKERTVVLDFCWGGISGTHKKITHSKRIFALNGRKARRTQIAAIRKRSGGVFSSTLSDHFKMCLYIFMIPSFVGTHFQWFERYSVSRGGRKVMAAFKALSECGDKDSPPDGRPFTSDPSTVPQTGAARTDLDSWTHELGFCPSQLRVEGFLLLLSFMWIGGTGR